MHATFSFIYTVLERIHFYLDEATLDAKFNDPFLVQHVIYPAMVDVLARLNLNQDNPITIRHQINLQVDQEFYTLPPNVQHVWRFAFTDVNGRVVREAYPRGVMNPLGPGWSIEGNMLQVRPFPQAAESAHVWYIPSGDVMCHYGTGYLRGRKFTLATSPTLGLLDRRPNAYAGSVLRLLSSTGPIQERIIESHDAERGLVFVRVPFSSGGVINNSSSSEAFLTGSSSSQASGTSSGHFGSSESSSSSDGFSQTYTYEIAPMGHQALYECIALASACKLGAAKKIAQVHMGYLQLEYRKARKTIMDNLANLQQRTGKGWEKDTVDHPMNRYGEF